MPSEIIASILEDHGDVLAHYASKYYDPVKAKEYYERTKQLKGKGSATASLTTNQRQGIGYAKNQIATSRQDELKQLAAKREAKLNDAAKRIKAKLEELIAKRADAILKRLEHLPKDADPKMVSNLMKSHSENVNKARREASKELQSTMKSVRDTFKKARDDVNAKYNKAQATEESNIRANVR